MLWQVLWIIALITSQLTLIQPTTRELPLLMSPQHEQQACVSQMRWQHRLSAITLAVQANADLALSEVCQYAAND